MARPKKVEDTGVETTETTAPAEKSSEDFSLGSPLVIKPIDLPFVVTIPETASSAQKEYAKVINSYAYQNPEKYEKKKDFMLKRLKSLAGMEVVVPEGGLSLNKSKVEFKFIRDNQGNEIPFGA